MVKMNTFECLTWILFADLCYGFLCGDGNKCECVFNTGIIICHNALKADEIDIDENLKLKYHSIIVGANMDCTEREKLGYKTSLKILSMDHQCENSEEMINKYNERRAGAANGHKSPMDERSMENVIEQKSLGTTFIIERVYDIVAGLLIILSLLLTFKLRHNVKPFTEKLSKRYRQNSTFLREIFKSKVSYLYLN